MAFENSVEHNYIFHVVVAHSFPEFGIGYKNELPWKLPKEMKRFKEVTTRCYEPTHLDKIIKWTGDKEYTSNDTVKNIVVFGRTTWTTIPDTGKKSILKDRKVIVITSTLDAYTDKQPFSNVGIISYSTWDGLRDTLISLIPSIKSGQLRNHVFFSGGASIYKQAFSTFPIACCHVSEVYLNQKNNKEMFDVFFDDLKAFNWNPEYSNTINYTDLTNSSSYTCEELSHLVLRDYSDFISDINKNTGDTTWFIYKMYATDYFMREYYILDYNAGYKYPRHQQQSNPMFKSHNHSCLVNRHQESQYLTILSDILNNGIENIDRTGVGTLSLFSTHQHYDLRDSFPILTTRRQWLKGIFEELKLYLSGKTDNTILQDKNIHIWDGNTSRDFLDKRGLSHYPIGDMGETYGFNFRHFGGDYINCKTDYNCGCGCGYDQLENVIELLKNDPTSRRIIINLWNPYTLHKAALPSCLMMYQFYVNTQDKTLHCQIYIRSSDFFLANNWNTCTGALLVHMLCALDDIHYTPGSITVITGDTHIYKTHIEQAKENLERQPLNFPKLIINSTKTYSSLNDIDFNDLHLIGYRPQPSIQAEMAV